MTETDIHARLVAIGAHLSKFEERLKTRARVSPDHLATNRELCDRYEALQEQVKGEEAADKAHGQRVGDLEHSVRMWLDRLDKDTVSGT